MKDKLSKAKAKVKKPVNKLMRRPDESIESAKLPYITNDTIAEHREEVLSDARKLILPLQHSKRRVIFLSLIIFAITIAAFSIYSVLSLYRFQNTSTFMYRVTQIIPFPVARAEGQFVSYESYLFELRHYMHYYESQQKMNFNTEEGKDQLEEFKKQAMDRVINDAYVKKLAKENNISVTTQDVDREIAIVRDQSRLGTSDQVFEDVLRDFWGWSVNDFKRSLRQQILARKVVSKLDTEAHHRATEVINALNQGEDFAEVAKRLSDDEATKDNGGEYGVSIDRSSRELSAKITDAIFQLQPGGHSGVIDTGYSLEIVKLIGLDGNKAQAAHIQINLKDINEFIADRREASPPRQWVKFAEPASE